MCEGGAGAVYVLWEPTSQCGGGAGDDKGVEGGEGKGEDGD